MQVLFYGISVPLTNSFTSTFCTRHLSENEAFASVNIKSTRNSTHLQYSDQIQLHWASKKFALAAIWEGETRSSFQNPGGLAPPGNSSATSSPRIYGDGE